MIYNLVHLYFILLAISKLFLSHNARIAPSKHLQNSQQSKAKLYQLIIQSSHK